MSVLLDGASDRVQMANSPANFPAQATILAWIRPTATVARDVILVGYGAPTAELTGLVLRGGDLLAWEASFTGGIARWTTPVALNAWQGVAATYDASSTANDPLMYIKPEGGAISAVTVTEAVAPSGTHEATMPDGFWAGGVFTSYSFTGRIAYLRVFSSILTQAQIDAELSAAAAVLAAMGDWAFVANANDASGNARHGTLLGDAVIDGTNPTLGGGGGPGVARAYYAGLYSLR